MVGEWIHPLRRWRLAEGLTLDAAAAGVGTVRQTWLDWETERRMPNRSYMPKLYVFTGGAVTADLMHFPKGYPCLDPQPELPLPAGPLFNDKSRAAAALLEEAA